MDSIGQQLKSKRQGQDASLERVHRDTRISLTYLQALEDDAFDRFPAEVYCIGFLKKYARYLQLDPDALIHQYHLMKKAAAAPPSLETVAPQRDEPPPATEVKIASSFEQINTASIAAVAGIGLLLAVLYLAQKPVPRAAESHVAFPKRFLPTIYDDVLQKQGGELTVTAIESCWISVTSDGAPVFEGILPVARAQTWIAENTFHVIAQQWSKIHMTLNGKAVDAASITPDQHTVNLTDFKNWKISNDG
jgi:hypothetical protein